MLTVTLKKPARLNAHGRTWERGVAVPVDLTTARLLAKNPRFEVNGLFEALDALAEGKTLDDLGISETPDNEDADVVETPPTPEDLFARIRAAADSLDVDNDDNFTADGKPTVAALEAILGEDITEEQRDAALTIPVARGKLEVEQKPAAPARPRAIKVKGGKAKAAAPAPAAPTTDEKAIEV